MLRKRRALAKLMIGRDAELADLNRSDREVVQAATIWACEKYNVTLPRLLTMKHGDHVPLAREFLATAIRLYAPALSHPQMARLFGGDQSTYSLADHRFMDRLECQDTISRFGVFLSNWVDTAPPAG